MLQKFDPRNEHLKIYVKDRICPRDEAKISVFDSVVQGGDAVWEGLRLYPQGILCLQRHLDRLLNSARALAFTDIPSDKFIRDAIRQTLKANGMDRETHIRLTLTRGEKITSGMDPRLNQKGSCLIVLAEWKPLVYDNDSGIRVISSSQRRNGPQFLDSKIHHNNLLNNILAKIQANVAGKDAALMLDQNGFVAELNGSNLFMIRQDRVYTPFASACLPGITRSLVIELCKKNGIPVREANISLAELICAEGVFATGTMGELTPVVEIDGRVVSSNSPTMNRIFSVFREMLTDFCEKI